ncbi:MAG: Uncharacterised protein [Glaciecola sp. HTCC2999]|jgi:hypothetical protein|nr:MAG: Uncharacterised protein [Glaciecola sp. HTCC2999]
MDNPKDANLRMKLSVVPILRIIAPYITARLAALNKE